MFNLCTINYLNFCYLINYSINPTKIFSRQFLRGCHTGVFSIPITRLFQNKITSFLIDFRVITPIIKMKANNINKSSREFFFEKLNFS